MKNSTKSMVFLKKANKNLLFINVVSSSENGDDFFKKIVTLFWLQFLIIIYYGF